MSTLSRAALLMFVAAVAAGQVKRIPQRTIWNQPFAPFRIAGNIYFVGVTGISSYLVVTPQGSLLLDGGLRESAPLIARSITELGFRLTDVRYLLNSHAHYDHAGGLEELRRLSGATMVASSGDANALRAGNRDVPPIRVDRIIRDGEALELGDTSMTAHVTPGHTPGCTTWTTTTKEEGRDYRVVFYCGTSVVYRLVGNAEYPHIVSDYEQSFRFFGSLQADVFLTEHPRDFNMRVKRQRQASGAPNPFVDPTELGRFVEGSEARFRTALEAERAQKAGTTSD